MRENKYMQEKMSALLIPLDTNADGREDRRRLV